MYMIILLTDINKGKFVYFGIKQGYEIKSSFMIFLRIFYILNLRRFLIDILSFFRFI